MLRELFVENIALIKSTRVKFIAGFNVITGETGAGKTILISAINAILGERISKNNIRQGADKALIEAKFFNVSDDVNDYLQKLGYETESDYLVISREIFKDGKTVCKINNRTVSISAVKTISNMLVSMHGQNDTIMLSSNDSHLKFIDLFADLENELYDYKLDYIKKNEMERELDEVCMSDEKRDAKLESLSYQINEIEQANFANINEEEELLEKRAIINNSVKIIDTLAEVNGIFSADEFGLLEQMGTLKKDFIHLSKFLPKIGEKSDRLEDMIYELQEYAAECREYIGEIQYNPQEINEIETRLDIIYRLKKKYGGSIQQILNHQESLQVEIGKLQKLEKLQQELKLKIEPLQKKVLEKASKIRDKRISKAPLFAEKVKKELEELDMPNVQLFVNFVEKPVADDGIDKLEILISTNIGQMPMPMVKIASGGEMSRIMLAIKNVLSRKDNIETMIFDEIDTGVSGSTASKIGRKLHEISQTRQIISVTHLAGVAAFADKHLLIQKTVQKNQTTTQVSELNVEERVHEIARIVSGETTEISLQNAREMLACTIQIEGKGV